MLGGRGTVDGVAAVFTPPKYVTDMRKNLNTNTMGHLGDMATRRQLEILQAPPEQRAEMYRQYNIDMMAAREAAAKEYSKGWRQVEQTRAEVERRQAEADELRARARTAKVTLFLLFLNF